MKYMIKKFISLFARCTRIFCIRKKSGKRTCNVCGNSFDSFFDGGIPEEIFESHYIIGGGYRKNMFCPFCKTIDRVRWLYYVLENRTDVSNMSGSILHFAPEKPVVNFIKQNKKVDYHTCDIIPGRAMHVVDITDISFGDNTFDYVISNHVMEHIVDEAKAVSEIKRVLKKDGKWIFSFPICTDMKTYEDASITTSKARLKAYGQKDHVRLYGTDYVERFEKYGLKLKVFKPELELDDSQIERFGFIKDDIIIVADPVND